MPPATFKLPLRVALSVTSSLPLSLESPVTVRSPWRLELPVTVKVSVVVPPVTFKPPPTAALLVTFRLPAVAAPVTDSVSVVAPPVTSKPPLRVDFPSASRVDFTAVAPSAATEKLPPAALIAPFSPTMNWPPSVPTASVPFTVAFLLTDKLSSTVIWPVVWRPVFT